MDHYASWQRIGWSVVPQTITSILVRRTKRRRNAQRHSIAAGPLRVCGGTPSRLVEWIGRFRSAPRIRRYPRQRSRLAPAPAVRSAYAEVLRPASDVPPEWLTQLKQGANGTHRPPDKGSATATGRSPSRSTVSMPGPPPNSTVSALRAPSSNPDTRGQTQGCVCPHRTPAHHWRQDKRCSHCRSPRGHWKRAGVWARACHRRSGQDAWSTRRPAPTADPQSEGGASLAVASAQVRKCPLRVHGGEPANRFPLTADQICSARGGEPFTQRPLVTQLPSAPRTRR